MVSKLLRTGFLAAIVAVLACGEAPPPPAQPPSVGAAAGKDHPAAANSAAPAGHGEEATGPKGGAGAAAVPADKAPAGAARGSAEGEEGNTLLSDLAEGLDPTQMGSATGLGADSGGAAGPNAGAKGSAGAVPPVPGAIGAGPGAAAAGPGAPPVKVDPTQSAAFKDKSAWRVPIDGSPVRGQSAALVTLVMFTDFQCRYSIRSKDVVDSLMTKYGDKLRVVHKSNPLGFHPRAEPAVELALEARAQKGDGGFWKAYDLLFAQQGKLDDADLEAIAKTVGMDVKKTTAAIAKKKHAASIDKDQELAADVGVNGTPHYFVNGRHIVGAQSIEVFTAIIDEEIVKAEALVKSGTAAAKVYDAIQKNARGPEPLKKVVVPAPTKDNPSRGPANAKVVIQMFGDFQCPFCKKASATIRDLEAAFPGKIRVVWRQRPLAMHKDAALAAEASVEAFKQKGADGFWKMHDLFFEDPKKLDRPGLEQAAAVVGLDPAKLAAALDGHTHASAVKADGKIADSVKLFGTPSFVINGYVVVGAQPLMNFKRIVNRALKEAR